MSDIAIQVEHLGKRYRIGELQRYKALRDTLTSALHAPFRAAASIAKGGRPKAKDPAGDNTLWAIKDISFEVKQGEVVGIIGRNGAGKSTLLKVLSRITEPTEGSAQMHGRVGSLLEVGTGFHPELTGRENIFLNGAILGMRKADINRKFDEIVAFAEVEKFIDTPVKHYSSGMFIRLAFAVAAHLEPEILLVDEVLAVGDAEFQKKCLGKMGEVAKEGRTILFVSHNLKSIEQLCSKSLLIDKGKVASFGPSSEVIRSYLSGLQSEIFAGTRLFPSGPKNSAASDHPVAFEELSITNSDGSVTSFIEFGDPFKINLLAKNYSRTQPFSLAFCVKTIRGEEIFTSHSHDQASLVCCEPGSVIKASCQISPNLLKPGLYLIDLGITDESWRPIDFVADAIG